MSKKPRNKKNSNAMRARRLSKVFTHGLGIAQINHDNCHVVDLRKGCKYKNATKSIIAQFTDNPHLWSIYLTCFCDDGMGNAHSRYNISHNFTLPAPFYQKDLVEGLRDSHNELARGCNQKHLTGLGWLAVTDDIDFDSVDTDKIFRELGAWDE